VAKNIQIRNVPDEVHEVYRRRAAAAGMSLQEYLLADLTQQAGQPTMREVLDRIASRDRTGSTVTVEDIVADIRRQRDA
jgi:plasmid stability protein